MEQPTRTRMTAAQFLELPEDRHPIQLIEGKLVEMAAPIPKHQRLVKRFANLLDNLVPNGEVFISPIAVYLDENNVPEPDVVWVSEDGRCEIQDTLLRGAPELIVEILSPTTARYDKTVKFLLYEKYRISEYWIVDPIREQVEVWELTADEYSLKGTFQPTDTFASKVLGNQMINLTKAFSI